MKIKITRRQILLTAIFSLLFFIGGLSFLSSQIDSFSGDHNLSIFSHNNIPLREISGSYLFHSKEDNKDYVYTIGDASSEISISEIDIASKKISNTYYIDIRKKILDKYSICTAKNIKPCKKMLDYMTKQWEAIYVDPKKRIFLLNESLATILVYDQVTEDITQTINLSRFTLEKKPKDTVMSYLDANSLGEGFLPLNNGHILVAKENYPPSIIEFGPSGSEPSGFNESLLVKEGAPFPLLGKRETMDPLFVWELPSGFQSCDISELMYSPERGLNILSQKCQMIMELSDLKTDKKSLLMENTYSLPRTIQKAEAFVLLPKKGEFIVFEDKKSVIQHNFYFLSEGGLSTKKL